MVKQKEKPAHMKPANKKPAHEKKAQEKKAQENKALEKQLREKLAPQKQHQVLGRQGRGSPAQLLNRVQQPTGSARERILNATERLLVRDGGDAVTIAAVAREAGVSKGGLFYHFPSKELLIEGLIARYVAAFDQMIKASGAAPGAATQAYLRSAERLTGPASQPIVALLAASASNSRALESLRDRYQQWQNRLESDRVPPASATAIRFAVDGLWLADTLDLAPAQGETRKAVIARLRALI